MSSSSETFTSNIPEYKRKCSNWLQTFTEWVSPRTDAPESYIFWSGVFCIAAGLRRKVFISKNTLGAWDCYPYMYIMLVGPYGMRKTTAAKQGEELMEEIPSMPSTPTMTTMPGLVDELMKSEDSSVYLLVEEFGDLIMKGGLEMYEFLTSIYDGKRKLHQKTLSRQVELADRPCVNMLAATTQKWIAESMPEVVIGGGLASRIIWVYEKDLRNERMYPKKIEGKDSAHFKTLKDNLIADLTHISENLLGEVTIPQEVQDWFENYYQNTIIKQKRLANDRLKSYFTRKHVFIHKLAMVVHFARTDSLELEMKDFQAAIILLEGLEPNLPQVFAGVGKNPFVLDVKAIVEFVKENSPVERAIVLREFEGIAQISLLEQLLQGCVAARKLELSLTGKGVDQKVYYSIPKEKEV